MSDYGQQVMRFCPTSATDVTGVGSALRAAREGAGLSLRSVATQAGVNAGHLARVENGERAISTLAHERVMRTIARHLAGRGT